MSRNLYQPKSINYNKFSKDVDINGNLTVNGDTTINGKLSVALNSGITIENNVAGATVDVPVPNDIWFPVRVNFSVNGAIRLPSLADVPYGYEYIFYRPIPGTPGNVAATTLVAIRPRDGETINGKQFDGNNVPGCLYINSVRDTTGTATRILRAEESWISSDGFNAIPQELPAVNTIITRWSGEKLINCNAAITLTLPDLSNIIGETIPCGSSVTILAINGIVTVQAGATGLFYGSINGVTLNGAASFNMANKDSCIITAMTDSIWWVH